MKNKLAQDCLTIGITALCVIAAGLLIFFAFFNFSTIRAVASDVIRILMPFIIGAVIAYLLSPLYNCVVRNTDDWLKRNTKLRSTRGLAKAAGVITSLGTTILVLSGLVALVAPQFVSSLVGIVNSMQSYMDQASLWLETFFGDNPEIASSIEEYMGTISAQIVDWATSSLLPNLENISGTMHNVSSVVGVLLSGLMVLFKVAKNLLIGFIVAAYILMGKSGMIAQAKKILYSVFRIPVANAVLKQFRYIHSVFGGFIRAKMVDSFLIGVLCFVGTTLMKTPYAVVISVIIGVTNVIPFFGPFIGAVPCICLILLISPIKAIYFVVFIIALQQFDGNILGPKIMSNSTGLSSFYVLLAILLFGGLFGFVGMIIGVPLFAVIYSLIRALVNSRLESNHLSTKTTDYLYLNEIKKQKDGTYSYQKGENPTVKR